MGRPPSFCEASSPGLADARGYGRVNLAHDDMILTALEKVAPGTGLREALDHILSAGAGALIVVGDVDKADKLCNGGFVIDTDFTPQRLFELSKMDGAITLDGGCRSILKANVHLVLDPTLPTAETGMRNRTAERLSRQTDALVVSVSQRRNLVTLYVSGERIVLEDIKVVLAKADQALQTLQRFRGRLDESSERLTSLEFDDVVTVGDVASVLQSQLMVQRLAQDVSRYVKELGLEGRLVGMQTDELIAGVDDGHVLLLRDYLVDGGARRPSIVRATLGHMTREEVVDELALAKVLGFPASGDVLEYHVQPRGFRILERIPLLPAGVAVRLVERFGTLPGLLQASEAQLNSVEGVGARRARAIREGIRRIREQRAF